MQATTQLMFIGFLIALLALTSEGQFFTKTGNSIPRMGRRSDQMLPGLVKRMARSLRFLVDMVQEYDMDGNGELNPEELMEVPLIQMAIRNYLDNRDLRGLSLERDSMSRNSSPTQELDQLRDK